MHALIVKKKRAPHIKLARVQKTKSGRTFILDFVDPVHKFAQSIILFDILPADVAEHLFEKLWLGWNERIQQGEWLEGNAPVLPFVDK